MSASAQCRSLTDHRMRPHSYSTQIINVHPGTKSRKITHCKQPWMPYLHPAANIYFATKLASEAAKYEDPDQGSPCGDHSQNGPANYRPQRAGQVCPRAIRQRNHQCEVLHNQAPLIRAPIVVGDGVWIASRAFIGPGVTVGDEVVVGACAVVMKDVPVGTVVAGNPAEFLRKRESS